MSAHTCLPVFVPIQTNRYISLKLGLAGPIYQVVRTLFGEVRRQATNRLQDHFAQQAQQGRQRRPVKASVDDDEDDDDEDEN